MVKKVRVSNHTATMNDELGLTEILARTKNFLKEQSLRRRRRMKVPVQTATARPAYTPSPLLMKWGLYYYLRSTTELDALLSIGTSTSKNVIEEQEVENVDEDIDEVKSLKKNKKRKKKKKNKTKNKRKKKNSMK